MRPIEILFAFVTPYLLAWLSAVMVQRLSVVPRSAQPATVAQNALGRLTRGQRWALLVYSIPELVFIVAALTVALGWNPGQGLDGAVLRWGLAGMALVRLGLSWPTWQDLLSGRAAMLAGPLRKIQFRERRALATEDGPIMVLPVEQALFAAHAAGTPATIYYAAKSKRVVAVQPGLPAAQP